MSHLKLVVSNKEKDMQKYSVRTWTKNGWRYRNVDEQEQKNLDSANRRRAYQQEEFTASVRTDVSPIEDIQDVIKYGSTHSELDKLSMSLQYIVRDPYTWYIKNGKLFKAVDPITQAIDGNYGRDRSEKPLDPLDSEKTVARMYFEQFEGLLSKDAGSEECADIMGRVIEDNDQIINDSPFIRVQLDSESNEDETNRAEDNISVLPELLPETQAKLIEVHNTFSVILDNAKEPVERELAGLAMEHAVDAVLQKDLTIRLNSPYCGHGYSAPRQQFVRIYTDIENEATVAKQSRESMFFNLLSEANDVRSYGELFDSVKDDGFTAKGFYTKIRGMYMHDKTLWAEWSTNDIKSPDGCVKKCARTLAREKYTEEYLSAGKDPSKLNRYLWANFDRKAGEYKGKKYQDGIWMQKRSKALQDAFMTKPQWTAIYKVLSIVRDKIRMCTNPTQEEKQIVSSIANKIKDLESLEEVRELKRNLQKRRWIYSDTYQVTDGKHRFVNRKNTYQFKPSWLDKVSTRSEACIWKILNRKEREAINKMVKNASKTTTEV